MDCNAAGIGAVIRPLVQQQALHARLPFLPSARPSFLLKLFYADQGDYLAITV